MQYRNGTIISTGAAVNLMLGFVPDKVEVYNYTVLAAASATPAVGYSLWINNVVPTGDALINTYTSGAPVTTLLTSNGITPVKTGGLWLTTTYTITGITNASPAVVTLSAVTGTNATPVANGDTITISGVNGMTGLNSNRYIVTGLSGDAFKLYDTFGNPVNTISSGSFTSSPSALIDIISYPALGPVLNTVTGQVITPAQPAGNQYDTGWEGVTLGTGVMGASTNVIW